MPLRKLLSLREVECIYSGANSGIWYSHQFARDLAARKPREEDFVATLVTDGVPLIADRWQSVLSPRGIALRLSGVFCHGHPQVVFGGHGRRVELADLLLVHQHIGRTRAFARAILVQAKMSNDGTHILKSNDKQLDLYKTWPVFKFVSGGLAPGYRDFGTNAKGSRYSLVLADQAYPEHISWPDQCPWATSPVVRNLEATQSFAKLLGNLLLFKDGRSCSLSAPRNDWAKTVKELLEVTGSRTYRRRNMGRGETYRGTIQQSNWAGHPVLVSYGSIPSNTRSGRMKQSRIPLVDRVFDETVDELNGGGDPPPPKEIEAPEDAPRGISSLIIETFDPER